MPTYKAPVSDTLFLLNDVFDYARYANAPGFSEAPLDVVEAVLRSPSSSTSVCCRRRARIWPVSPRAPRP